MIQQLSVNHVIVGASDVPASAAFYVNVLGFKDLGDNPHNVEARTMVFHAADGSEAFEVVIHPYDHWLTPNPPLLALEVDVDTFESIQAAARCHQVEVSDSGQVEIRGVRYQRFYVTDPSACRIEILTGA
jgi:catechol 2,3-dioxygenase-like lactoylglutathione lyase family enzyme